LGGEEVGVDASRILEDEADGGFGLAVGGWGGVEEAEELKHGPEDEAEEEWVSVCVSFESERVKNTDAVFPAKIRRPIVMSVYTESWNGI
jgi:hypothetical protein